MECQRIILRCTALTICVVKADTGLDQSAVWLTIVNSQIVFKHDQPPKAMIIDGILRTINGKFSNESLPYTLPANLERFFMGRDSKINSMKEGNFMKTMQIFEPAMCCSTGLCGVGVDPELLRISTVLDTLKKRTA